MKSKCLYLFLLTFFIVPLVNHSNNVGKKVLHSANSIQHQPQAIHNNITKRSVRKNLNNNHSKKKSITQNPIVKLGFFLVKYTVKIAFWISKISMKIALKIIGMIFMSIISTLTSIVAVPAMMYVGWKYIYKPYKLKQIKKKTEEQIT